MVEKKLQILLQLGKTMMTEHSDSLRKCFVTACIELMFKQRFSTPIEKRLLLYMYVCTIAFRRSRY